jgi:hypothetical protein
MQMETSRPRTLGTLVIAIFPTNLHNAFPQKKKKPHNPSPHSKAGTKTKT